MEKEAEEARALAEARAMDPACEDDLPEDEWAWTHANGTKMRIKDLTSEYITNIIKMWADGRVDRYMLNTDVWAAVRAEAKKRGLDCYKLMVMAPEAGP